MISFSLTGCHTQVKLPTPTKGRISGCTHFPKVLTLYEMQSRLGFGFGSPSPFLTTVNITPWSVIWKSDLSDKIKCIFFQAAVVSILPNRCTTWTLTKCKEKKLECYEPYWINPGSNIPQNSSYTVTYLPSLKSFKSDELDMQDTAGEVRASL